MSYLADIDADHTLTPLQAASCTYRIALGPRARQKVLSLQTVSSRGEPSTPALCANAHRFCLHAAVRCGTEQRKALERLCHYITRAGAGAHELGAPAQTRVQQRSRTLSELRRRLEDHRRHRRSLGNRAHPHPSGPARRRCSGRPEFTTAREPQNS